ncbi:hypothetical protein L6472_05985 [Prevotella sp. E13-17]|uniref:hypothetical protein n=1 Tax=Prevotella sp. E13-17 TaxID=2913616 RepID=UPI001EDB3EE3|nr:hypothetical protein [Prevotella sp. E13-17]UKK52127.1 hypothetical protein L6472_05985 [Prevotella sp. E13-17]
MKPLYVITAKNRLTGEREPISAKCTSEVTLKHMLKRYLRIPAKKRTHTRPVITIVQEDIFK